MRSDGVHVPTFSDRSFWNMATKVPFEPLQRLLLSVELPSLLAEQH